MGKSVYEMVTDRIIDQLEHGVIPWRKPWTGVSSGAYNRITKRPYSLLNQILLKHQNEYATFKQWSSLGGKIKKGSKSEIVVFWKIQPIEEVKEDGTKEIKNIPFLRYYQVFHISCVEGVEPLKREELTELEPIENAEQIINDYVGREGLSFTATMTDEAYYSPIRDAVVVPCKKQYIDINEYYSTVFHELTHSTGHKTRLDRLDSGLKIASFGSEDYSKEELTAEIGSASILNLLGIETPKTFKNSAAYIQNWLSVLKNDNRFIVSASSKAEKAVKYILNEV